MVVALLNCSRIAVESKSNRGCNHSLIERQTVSGWPICLRVKITAVKEARRAVFCWAGFGSATMSVTATHTRTSASGSPPAN